MGDLSDLMRQSNKHWRMRQASGNHCGTNTSVLNYNTPYHASIGCEPSRVFHGRIPYNVLDIKMGNRPQ